MRLEDTVIGSSCRVARKNLKDLQKSSVVEWKSLALEHSVQGKQECRIQPSRPRQDEVSCSSGNCSVFGMTGMMFKGVE